MTERGLLGADGRAVFEGHIPQCNGLFLVEPAHMRLRQPRGEQWQVGVLQRTECNFVHGVLTIFVSLA
jgi:hypothetical protein